MLNTQEIANRLEEAGINANAKKVADYARNKRFQGAKKTKNGWAIPESSFIQFLEQERMKMSLQKPKPKRLFLFFSSLCTLALAFIAFNGGFKDTLDIAADLFNFISTSGSSEATTSPASPTEASVSSSTTPTLQPTPEIEAAPFKIVNVHVLSGIEGMEFPDYHRIEVHTKNSTNETIMITDFQINIHSFADNCELNTINRFPKLSEQPYIVVGKIDKSNELAPGSYSLSIQIYNPRLELDEEFQEYARGTIVFLGPCEYKFELKAPATIPLPSKSRIPLTVFIPKQFTLQEGNPGLPKEFPSIPEGFYDNYNIDRHQISITLIDENNHKSEYTLPKTTVGESG